MRYRRQIGLCCLLTCLREMLAHSDWGSSCWDWKKKGFMQMMGFQNVTLAICLVIITAKGLDAAIWGGGGAQERLHEVCFRFFLFDQRFPIFICCSCFTPCRGLKWSLHTCIMRGNANRFAAYYASEVLQEGKSIQFFKVLQLPTRRQKWGENVHSIKVSKQFWVCVCHLDPQTNRLAIVPSKEYVSLFPYKSHAWQLPVVVHSDHPDGHLMASL